MNEGSELAAVVWIRKEAFRAREDVIRGIGELNFLPQVMEISSPQPVDVSDAGLLYDLNDLVSQRLVEAFREAER